MTVDLYMEKLNLTITSMASAQVTFTFEDILNLYEQVQAKYKFDEVLINQSVNHGFHIHQGLWRPWTATDRDLVPFEPQ